MRTKPQALLPLESSHKLPWGVRFLVRPESNHRTPEIGGVARRQRFLPAAVVALRRPLSVRPDGRANPEGVEPSSGDPVPAGSPVQAFHFPPTARQQRPSGADTQDNVCATPVGFWSVRGALRLERCTRKHLGVCCREAGK